MSHAWACIYRKNTPGYTNPWDACAEEVDSIIRCSSGQFNHPLTVRFSGYTMGTPDINKTDKVFYAGSSGIFEVLITTGTSSIGCSGASGYLTLSQYSTLIDPIRNPGNNLFLNTGFIVNSTGFYSGIFAVPSPSGNINTPLSGYVAAISGMWTGETDILDYNLNIFPAPTVNVNFDSVANHVTFDISNVDSFLPATASIELAVGSPDATPTSYGPWYLAAGATSPSTMVPLSSNFVYLSAFMLPSGFTKGVLGPTKSGGHPPAVDDISFHWIYRNPNDPAPTASLQVLVPPDKVDQFDSTNHVEPSYSTDNVNWSLIGYLDVIDPTTSPVGSGLGQYTFDISDLIGYNPLYIAASGFFFDDGGMFNKFYGPRSNTLQIDFGAVKAYAQTSTSSCGVNVRWEGPYVGHGYKVYVSGIGGGVFSSPFDPDSFYAWTHNIKNDPSFACNTPYGYRVCQTDVSAICFKSC